ncbi:hypothetical protein PV05_11145 [Exophiala xenobiotica]|uniref:Major facilitator superfamily (MFS) profile domain-containing protein n=1 Tax=Exophiala xenobiotica TaxID=348802 RepID=A0A0D2BBD9_9EURO|nr:uncharacterized protein PV05_11145 [Exophiala xenobiotica]KIW49471.1 hypothetical protein PV05_11145 [Exophiala xenobiotica]
MTGQTAALYDIGCLVGAVFALFIASRIGHRKALLLGSSIIIVGAIIQTASIKPRHADRWTDHQRDWQRLSHSRTDLPVHQGGMAITAIATPMTSFTAGAVAIFGIFFFYFNYGVGFQSSPWIHGIKVTPLKLRHFAGGIASASAWIWNYAVVQITQPGIESIGYKYFIVWAVLNFTWIWVIYFFFPETAKKTLEELDFIFMKPEDRPPIAVQELGRSDSVCSEKGVKDKGEEIATKNIARDDTTHIVEV